MHLIHQHPNAGVNQIVQLNAAREMKVHSLLSSFQHHLKYNLTGYPQRDWREPLHLFGRIIAIADTYVALTSYRPYRAYTLSPDSALGVMLEGTGKDFDPVLLKMFVNMLGTYPIGTLLQLDTGHLALVADSPEETNPDRPKVIILEPDNKGGFIKKETVDLAEKEKLTGKYLRNIISSMNPSVYRIQPMEYLF